jgi:hypothetical protein
MGGAKMNELQTFAVFCPKAFAGIGKSLPDTITDRSIVIRLERRTREEQVERFRRREVSETAEPLFQWLGSWAQDNTLTLIEARPELPDELDDRAQDCWEPLLAIADLAGEEWNARGRQTAIEISTGAEREDDSLTTLLLADIRDIFEADGAERFKTADLIARLAQIEESPWGDWHGKEITAHALSALLRPFRIKTLPVWTEGKTVRGYKCEQFADAWSRVLGVRSVRGVRSLSSSENSPNAPNAPNASGTWDDEDLDFGDDDAHRLCLICELRPVVGGPCSLRCAECRGEAPSEDRRDPPQRARARARPPRG